ncbi:MAG: DUF1824 family protein [Cyanobacteria bacterium J06621_8]
MSNLTLEQALKILRSYDCVRPSSTEGTIEPEQLRNSLLMIVRLSDSQNLGICADNFNQGFTALSSYIEAFGYQLKLEQDNSVPESEPVYLKFSSQKMSYYSSQYEGTYRGVLISCQDEADVVAGTYGHFPLDLFNAD